MLEALTGLPIFEPPIIAGRVDYTDPEQLILSERHIYSWHLMPTAEVRQRLRAASARPIFLLRSPADLAVSMYHHFADNIDADIGRGRNVQHHFSEMSREQGILAVVEGIRRTDFLWAGLGPHLRQMQGMLEFAEGHPCFVATFSTLTGRAKRAELERIVRFLKLEVRDERIDEVVSASSFENMRRRAVAKGTGSHYREGKSGAHREVLEHAHVRAIAEQQALHAPRLAELLERRGLSF